MTMVTTLFKNCQLSINFFQNVLFKHVQQYERGRYDELTLLEILRLKRFKADSYDYMRY